jgi:hypothetical protein
MRWVILRATDIFTPAIDWEDMIVVNRRPMLNNGNARIPLKLREAAILFEGNGRADEVPGSVQISDCPLSRFGKRDFYV